MEETPPPTGDAPDAAATPPASAASSAEPAAAPRPVLRRESLRKIWPYLWKRRWAILTLFALMGIYSAGLQLRNLVPGLFFDGVLVSGVGELESILPARVHAYLESFGIGRGPRVAPIVLKGPVSDLRIDHYARESRKQAGRIVFEDGACSFAFEGYEGRIQTDFTKLRVDLASDAPPTAGPDGAIVAIARGDIDIERRPAGDPGVDRRESLLAFLVVFGVVVCLIIAGSRFLFKFLEEVILQGILADLRQELIAHLSVLSLSFFNNRSRGDLLSRVSNDLTKLNASLQLIVGDLLLEPIVLVISAGVCIYISWWMALIVLAAFPVLFWIMSKSGGRVRRRSRKQSARRGLMTMAVEQLFSGIRTVKSFTMEEYERKHFAEKNAAVVQQTIRTARAKIFANAAVELASHLGVIVVLGIGGYFLIRGSLGLTVGELVWFIASVNTMYHPVKNLAKAYTSFQDSMGAMDRVMEIFEIRPTVIERPGAAPLPPFERSIRYENVSFSYGREPVLEDIDLEIPAGSLTAIVGPTGAGKSTLVDLLLRFYDPTAGRITIDGRDIREATLDSLIRQVAIVSQDPFLFDTTIRNNILYGRPGATQDEIEAAARMANIHDFIQGLPDGYETPIGDRGVMLSGGQRQRVTIARSLLKDAPILILDEATSNLDSESEAEVQKALENLIRVRSTIAIAHRLSTILQADQIIVLDHGRIVERGAYRDLMAAQGLFYRLYSKQTGGTVEAR